MLDIHLNWMLVLIANFLGLMVVLNIILFKPLLKIFKERDDTVKGSLTAAKDMNTRKEEGILKMNREIMEARGRPNRHSKVSGAKALETQKKFLSDAESQAAVMLQQAREELRAEVVRARGALKSDVEKFSDEIVRKLVKA